MAQLKNSGETGERQRRRKNLIAFNVVEKDSEDPQAVAQQLFPDGPGSSSGVYISVVAAFRVGRKQEGSTKPRPLMMEFSSTRQASTRR